MTRATTDYDRLVTAAPVNRAAALERTPRGTGWEPPAGSLNPGGRWIAPPELRAVPADTEDYTGARFGRMVVIGMYAKVNPQSGARWVMRCSCGAYETRRSKLLRLGTDRALLMCSACDYLEEMKAGRKPARRRA